MFCPSRNRDQGFTLIELLIVVAIIAILAAIAVPNFLEAQARSKLSRTRTDMRTVAVALESYFIDSNSYPANNTDESLKTGLHALTSPLTYLTAVPHTDIFLPKDTPLEHENGTPLGMHDGALRFYNYNSYGNPAEGLTYAERVAGGGSSPYYRNAFLLHSVGPDQRLGNLGMYGWNGDQCNVAPAAFQGINTLYDPSNGTISGGDMGRYGGEVLPLGCGGYVYAAINEGF